MNPRLQFARGATATNFQVAALLDQLKPGSEEARLAREGAEAASLVFEELNSGSYSSREEEDLSSEVTDLVSDTLDLLLNYSITKGLQ